MGRRPGHEAGEAVGRVGRLPAASAGEPQGVVKWWKVTTGADTRPWQAAQIRR